MKLLAVLQEAVVAASQAIRGFQRKGISIWSSFLLCKAFGTQGGRLPHGEGGGGGGGIFTVDSLTNPYLLNVPEALAIFPA